MSNAEENKEKSYEIIQIPTVRITSSNAYTKALEIIPVAYLYIKKERHTKDRHTESGKRRRWLYEIKGSDISVQLLSHWRLPRRPTTANQSS